MTRSEVRLRLATLPSNSGSAAKVARIGVERMAAMESIRYCDVCTATAGG